MISICFCTPDQVGPEAWSDLVVRSSSNVFADPAALQAAVGTGYADIRMMVARDGEGGKLVGLWALRLRRIWPLWPKILEALPYDYAFLSNPVVDPSFVSDVVPAFLAAIAASALPRVISLRDWDAEAPSHGALMAATAARGGKPRQLSSDDRPVVTRQFGVKASGSTRKKLRQDWNRLTAAGAVELANDRAPGAVCAAFEVFLEMEARSWKGGEGTALLSDARDADFVRRMVGNLAEQGRASVALLKLDGVAIAAQVLMYCGASAYTWKTAYSADHARYSPGALLVDKMTEQLLATPGIERIDSCSTSDGFMAQLWAGRRPMVELLVPVTPNTPAFYMEAIRRGGFHMLRDLRNRARSRIRHLKKRSR